MVRPTSERLVTEARLPTLVGGLSLVPTKITPGTEGQVLTTVSGATAWATLAGGGGGAVGAATTTAAGIVELATDAETTTGTDTTRAITPSNLKVVADTKAGISHTHAYSSLTSIPTSFAPSAHDAALITSGTLPDARLRPSLQSLAQDISNLNLHNFRYTGFYRGSAVTNAPDANWWYYTVVAHDGGNFTDYEAHEFFGPRIFRGYFNNNVWSGWKQIYTSDEAYTKTATDTLLAGKQAAGSYAASSHSHSGADITSGTVAAARLPFQIAYGSTTGITPVGTFNASDAGGVMPFGTADVTLPAGMFTSPPIVTLTPVSGSSAQIMVTVNAITATGFTVVLRRSNNTATSVQWMAIGT
jgi:hypothetical protein